MSELPVLGSAEDSTEDPTEHDDIPASTGSGGGPGGRRRLRTRWIVLGAAGVVLLVAAAVLGPLAWRLLTRETVTLSTPPSLAGLTEDTSDSANQTADYLRTAVAAKISLDSSVGAVYRDPTSADRDVLFFGGTAFILTPDRQLDQALGLLNDDSGTVSGLHAVDPGQLGGSMKCGTTPGDNGTTMAVCGWADSGSLAVALFPGRTVDQAAELLRQMRAGMEHRS
jgi:hypothetical protein